MPARYLLGSSFLQTYNELEIIVKHKFKTSFRNHILLRNKQSFFFKADERFIES